MTYAGFSGLGSHSFWSEVALAISTPVHILLMAITSIEVYGVVIAGWASNSKYPFIAALRASAQMVSYKLPWALTVIGALVLTA